MITLTRPLIIFDLETTGLEVQTARIWEIGFQLFEHEFPSKPTKEWELVLNPGIPLPQEIIALEAKHGRIISDELLADKPTFNQVGPHLVKGFVNCDFAGKNVRYDLQVLAAEMARYDIPWAYTTAKIICADQLERIGEPRTLTHLYKKHTGKDLIGAHSAMVDVKATVELIEAQLRAYPVIPRNLSELHDKQWPGFIDGEGKFRFVGDTPMCMFGKYRNTPMRQMALDYWKFILKSDFSPEIKTIAMNAVNGIYPTRSGS